MNATKSVFFSQDLSEVIGNLDLSQASGIFLLADSNTLEHCWPVLAESLPEHRDLIEILEVPPGEDTKCLEVAAQLWSTLMELGTDRQSMLINLGGGMVTDLGGFVASTYKRGIAFCNIPTSLLGQVDASIGGKTGIDLGSFKNQVGTFANPQCTLISSSFLETLPQRELTSGLAEVIKHGLIASVSLLEKLEALSSASPTEISPLIEEAASVKLSIVDADPNEKGERKKLNFGHTVGHAVESLSLENNEALTHGEAVAVGMFVESLLSKKILDLNDSESKRIEKLLVIHFENSLRRAFDKKAIWEVMQHDKKNVSGKVNCTLISSIGSAKIDNEISIEDFEEVWDQFENFQKWINE